MSFSMPPSILSGPFVARALAYTPYLRGLELPESNLAAFDV